MCRLSLEVFYWRCGHSRSYKLPSLNPSCSLTQSKLNYKFDQKCIRCVVGHQNTQLLWEEVTEEGYLCAGHTGILTLRSPLSQIESCKTYSTPQELWAARRSWHLRYFENTYKGDSTIISCSLLPIVHPTDIPENQDICAFCRGSFVETGDDILYRWGRKTTPLQPHLRIPVSTRRFRILRRLSPMPKTLLGCRPSRNFHHAGHDR